MQFMFQYPDVHGTEQDMLESGDVADIAVALERADWNGLSFTEHPAPGANWLERGGHQSLDPFIALAGAATVTTRLKLLSYLAVLPYRNPLMLAKTSATLDRISHGRFILGAGAGYLKGEFKALGVDFEERNALFDEVNVAGRFSILVHFPGHHGMEVTDLDAGRVTRTGPPGRLVW